MNDIGYRLLMSLLITVFQRSVPAFDDLSKTVHENRFVAQTLAIIVILATFFVTLVSLVSILTNEDTVLLSEPVSDYFYIFVPKIPLMFGRSDRGGEASHTNLSSSGENNWTTPNWNVTSDDSTKLIPRVQDDYSPLSMVIYLSSLYLGDSR